MNDFISQFEAAIQNAGIEPPANIVADGELHRFPTNGRPSDTAGYYVLYPDGIPAGHFGCWRNGISQDWMADVGRKPSEVEKQAHRKRMVAMQATRAEEKRRRNDEARQTAKGKLQAAKPETGLYKYLELKGVGPHGLKSDGFNLLVPMRDSEGVLHSLQSISPDGSKKFLSGGRVKGMYYGIGQPNGVLCIAEGFATGASIHEATGHAVAVAFNSENLKPVAQALREKFPDLKLIVCADDDSKTEGNPGITSATEAANSVGGLLAVPDFGDDRPGGATDFNDLHQHAGKEAVKASVEAAEPVTDVEAPETGNGPSVRLIQGDSITPEPIQWVWNGWLAAGKMHVLAGAPGTGKTTLCMGLAASITTGGRWPDGTKAEQGHVLIWSGEDDPQDTLIPRLHACGADLSRIHFVSSVHQDGDSRAFDPAYDIPHLRRQLELTKVPIKLMIVDPVVSATAGDSHKNAEVRRNLQPLVDLAQSIRCALVGVSHFSKGTSGKDPVDRVTGSLAYGALARVVLATAKLKDGPGRILARAKSNIGIDTGGFHYDLVQEELDRYPGVHASRLLWGEPIEGSALKLLADAEAHDEERSATDEAEEFLHHLLADGAMKARDVQKEARQAGISDKSLRRARERLKIKPKKASFAGGWVWELPPAQDAQLAQDAQVVPLRKQGIFEDEGHLREESEKF